MAVNPYIASALVADVRRRAFMSVNDSIPDADVIAWLTSEVQTYIASLLVSMRQEYLVSTQDVAFTGASATVPTPARSVAQGVRDVAIVDSQCVRPLPYVEPERVSIWGLTGTSVGGFSLRGQSILLVPPGSSGTMRVTYVQRPGIIVDSTQTAQVTGVAGNVVTCAGGLPVGWVTGNVFDLCSGQAGFQNWAIDLVGTVSGSTVTFASVPATLGVGDFLTLSGQTPGPQCPLELYPLLCQRVAVKLAESMGSARLKDINGMCDGQRKEAEVLLSPRAQEATHVIVRREGYGWGGTRPARGRWV